MKRVKPDANKKSEHNEKNKKWTKRRKKILKQTAMHSETENNWERDREPAGNQLVQWQQWDWESEQVPAVSHFRNLKLLNTGKNLLYVHLFSSIL